MITITTAVLLAAGAIMNTGSAVSIINDAMDSWHTAADRGDIETYTSLMTEDVVFLGTDKTERWVGAEFVDFATPYFADGHGWTYAPVERHVTVRGDTAWIDEVLFSASYGHCRGTGVLLFDDEHGWRIAHYGLAFLVPNDVAKETRKIVSDYEKKENEE